MLYQDQFEAMSRPELVSMAATMGVVNSTSMSKKELVQEMVMRKMQIQKDIAHPNETSEENPSDVRLRTRPPAPNCTQKEVMDVCEPYLARGLIITFPEPDQFHMRFGLQEDTGTLRQPLRVIQRRADAMSRTNQGVK